MSTFIAHPLGFLSAEAFSEAGYDQKHLDLISARTDDLSKIVRDYQSKHQQIEADTGLNSNGKVDRQGEARLRAVEAIKKLPLPPPGLVRDIAAARADLPTQLNPDPAKASLYGEIRSWFLKLSATERQDVVSHMVTKGDRDTLVALKGFPPAFQSLTPEKLQEIEQMVIKTAHPDRSEKLQTLQSVASILHTNSQKALSLVGAHALAA